MTEIEKRLNELKPLGAGDKTCEDCLSIKIEKLSVCKKCIADTPAFIEIMNRLCAPLHNKG